MVDGLGAAPTLKWRRGRFQVADEHGFSMILRMSAAAVVLAATAPVLAQAAPSPAPPAVMAARDACGYDLSAPILVKWRALLGQGGRLGCPTTTDAETPQSPYGARGRIATFVGRDKLGAVVVW